jgi:uncharacterized damage-inducible protein DinB
MTRPRFSRELVRLLCHPVERQQLVDDDLAHHIISLSGWGSMATTHDSPKYHRHSAPVQTSAGRVRLSGDGYAPGMSDTTDDAATEQSEQDHGWVAPAVDRREPARESGERQALEEWLDFHRETLLSKCSGLTADQLKERAVAPPRLSLLWLVRHMTEVERWWFRMHAGQLDLEFPYDPESNGADFEDLDAADAAANLAAYRDEIEAAKAVVADKSLEDVVPSRGDHPERTRDIRWIYLHMIEEYARHNGHADLIRERIDGQTGD